MKQYSILSLCLAGLLLLAGCGGASENTPAPTSGTQATPAPEPTTYTALSVGDEAPDFTVTLADGGEFTLSDHRGEVVVLNFWATWCSPCVGEMPELAELAEAYRDKGVYLLAINCGQTAETVRDFLETQGLSLNVGLDEVMDVQDKYPSNGIPYTVYIDPEGKAAYIQPGAYKTDNYGHLSRALDEVLAQFPDAGANT